MTRIVSCGRGSILRARVREKDAPSDQLSRLPDPCNSSPSVTSPPSQPQSQASVLSTNFHVLQRDQSYNSGFEWTEISIFGARNGMANQKHRSRNSGSLSALLSQLREQER